MTINEFEDIKARFYNDLDSLREDCILLVAVPEGINPELRRFYTLARMKETMDSISTAFTKVTSEDIN